MGSHEISNSHYYNTILALILLDGAPQSCAITNINTHYDLWHRSCNHACEYIAMLMSQAIATA